MPGAVPVLVFEFVVDVADEDVETVRTPGDRGGVTDDDATEVLPGRPARCGVEDASKRTAGSGD